MGHFVNYTCDSNGNMVSDDTRGNDLSGSLQGAGGIGGLLARTDNTQLLLIQDWTLASACYHADGNGNVTCLMYTNQFIAAKYLYDPYGNTLSMYGPLAGANLYRFSSKEYHPNSGLVYYLYRFYDPNLQRWPNRDPLGEFGFEIIRRHTAKSMHTRTGVAELAQGPSLYEFVRNFPTIKVDLHGLQSAGGYPVEPNQPVWPYGLQGPNNTDPEAPAPCPDGLGPWNGEEGDPNGYGFGKMGEWAAEAIACLVKPLTSSCPSAPPRPQPQSFPPCSICQQNAPPPIIIR